MVTIGSDKISEFETLYFSSTNSREKILALLVGEDIADEKTPSKYVRFEGRTLSVVPFAFENGSPFKLKSKPFHSKTLNHPFSTSFF